MQAFVSEYDQYGKENTNTTALPYGMRRDLFDSLESIMTVSADERQGRRLQREGIPSSSRFYLDIDLWNPGEESAYQAMMASFRNFIESRNGRIVKDPLRIPSLLF